jgi:hypothetical protein
MKRNKQNNWCLEKWWQKAIYCAGWFYAGILILSFIAGFTAGVYGF